MNMIFRDLLNKNLESTSSPNEWKSKDKGERFPLVFCSKLHLWIQKHGGKVIVRLHDDNRRNKDHHIRRNPQEPKNRPYYVIVGSSQKGQVSW